MEPPARNSMMDRLVAAAGAGPDMLRLLSA
jgi:hypothetical protein